MLLTLIRNTLLLLLFIISFSFISLTKQNNNEKVFVDSGGGHYTSDGKYHYDSDGDGRADTVASRGTAGQAQEAANNGFIPAKTLERMTNPDGTLKSLYLQDRQQKILNTNKIIETQDDSDWEEIDTN